MAPRHQQHEEDDVDMVYDPDQNPEEQRDVRQKYRTIATGKPLAITLKRLAHGNNLCIGLTKDTPVESLVGTVHEADDLFRKGNYYYVVLVKANAKGHIWISSQRYCGSNT